MFFSVYWSGDVLMVPWLKLYSRIRRNVFMTYVSLWIEYMVLYKHIQPLVVCPWLSPTYRTYQKTSILSFQVNVHYLVLFGSSVCIHSSYILDHRKVICNVGFTTDLTFCIWRQLCRENVAWIAISLIVVSRIRVFNMVYLYHFDVLCVVSLQYFTVYRFQCKNIIAFWQYFNFCWYLYVKCHVF